MRNGLQMPSVNHQSAFKEQLLSEQAELQMSLQDAAQAAAAVELDQTVQGRLSRMDAMRAQEMAKAALQRKTVRVQQVTAALKRIEQDEFGDCVDCGNEIALARLQFNPCATLCIACAEAREA